jgi:hypothetical protein
VSEPLYPRHASAPVEQLVVAPSVTNFWVNGGDRRAIASKGDDGVWRPISYPDRAWRHEADGSWTSYDPRWFR